MQSANNFTTNTGAMPWDWGDWLNFGARVYGEKYTIAVERFGMKIQTLKQYASVAARFPEKCRRLHLSWSHHQSVASVDNADRRDKLLIQAEQEGWSVSRIRAESNASPAVDIANLKESDIADLSESELKRICDAFDLLQGIQHVKIQNLLDVIPLYEEFDGIHAACMAIPLGPQRNFNSLVYFIREYGLTIPLIRTKDHLLLDGKRRLLACHFLGIPIRVVDDDPGCNPWQTAYSFNLVGRGHETKELMCNKTIERFDREMAREVTTAEVPASLSTQLRPACIPRE